ISAPFEVGVVAVEFCVDVFQSGNFVAKKLWKWLSTFSEPWVPGTRGIRIGERRAPEVMSKSVSEGFGSRARVSSERSVQAVVKVGNKGRRIGRKRRKSGAMVGRQGG